MLEWRTYKALVTETSTYCERRILEMRKLPGTMRTFTAMETIRSSLFSIMNRQSTLTPPSYLVQPCNYETLEYPTVLYTYSD